MRRQHGAQVPERGRHAVRRDGDQRRKHVAVPAVAKVPPSQSLGRVGNALWLR